MNLKIIALMAGSIIIASFITYTIVHKSEESNCSVLLKKKQEEEQVTRKFLKHKQYKIGDGERF